MDEYLPSNQFYFTFPYPDQSRSETEEGRGPGLLEGMASRDYPSPPPLASSPTESLVFDYQAHPYQAAPPEPPALHSLSLALVSPITTTTTTATALTAHGLGLSNYGTGGSASIHEEAFNPHWDDMVNLRQANVTLRLSRAWSEADSVVTEHSRLLAGGGDPTGEATPAGLRHRGELPPPRSSLALRLAGWTDTSWKRFLLLQLLPVLVVVFWFSVPIPVDLWPGYIWPDDEDPSVPPTTTTITTTTTNPTNTMAGFRATDTDRGDADDPSIGRPAKMNFWFFLLFYYGGYNAVALWLVNQIFRVYALNWWPSSMTAWSANVMTWLSTLVVGAIIYYCALQNLEKFTLTWVLLTLTTLLLPVLVSLGVLRSQNRNRHRHTLTEFQKIFLAEAEWRTPSSYRRFLWFAVTLSITYLALLAGEYLAHLFLSTLPHTWLDGLIYVYSWVITVFVFGYVAEWIIEAKIHSWPLTMIYRYYFTLIYFIFYRSLFARLRSLDQFVLVQLGSSLWVVCIYPIRMSRWVHSLLVYLFGLERPYEDYVKHISRTFFLRNYAENTTMVAFLASVVILHFGPNARFYPYFSFRPPVDDHPEHQYTLALTLWASLAVWASELAASFCTRWIVWLCYGHAIGREAAKDFQRYPELALAMIFVAIHVLQDMLLALIQLDFT